MTSEEFPSDEYFEDLQLAHAHREYAVYKTCYDLLCLEEYKGHTLSHVTHVLVSGQAGVGKTAMISQLAYQWAIKRQKPKKRLSYKIKESMENMQSLDKFEYVFVVDLRQCEPDMCLVDAIRCQLLTNVSRQHLEEFLTNHASECLYLFDGYMEMSANDKLLKSDLLFGSHVIVTTRPNKVELFCENHKEYVQVISKGLSEASIARFIQTYFAKSKETSDRLLKTIFDNPSVKNLAHFPLLLSMICGIWKSQNTLPSAISELYRLAIDQLVCHMKAREPHFVSMSSEEFENCFSIDQIMVHIGKTALHGLLQDLKLIFEEEDFSSPEEVDQACSLGILSKGSKVSDVDKVDYISFTDKTFQEYCAAVYLSSVAKSENQELFKPYLCQMDLGDMEYVLRFCCGTGQKAAEYVLAYVADVYNIETQKHPTTDGVLRQICRLPLLLLFETESKLGVIDKLHSTLSSSFACMTIYVDDDPVYRSVLKYFIDRFESQKLWTECVQTPYVYMHCGYMTGHGSEACKCESHFELLAKMPHLKELTIQHLSLGEQFRRSPDNFEFKFIKGLANSLQVLTLINYRTFVEFVCDFVEELSHDVQLHLDLLHACYFECSTLDSEKLSNLLHTVHSRGGSIKKLEIERAVSKNKEKKEDYNMKQVIQHVTPFCAILEQISVSRLEDELTKECVDMLCDGIIQAGRKMRSQDSTCNERNDTLGDGIKQAHHNGSSQDSACDEREDVLFDGIIQAGCKLSSQDFSCDESEEVAIKLSNQLDVCLPLQRASIYLAKTYHPQ